MCDRLRFSALLLSVHFGRELWIPALAKREVQDHRPVPEPPLLREQEAARELGVAGVCADGEDRSRGCRRRLGERRAMDRRERGEQRNDEPRPPHHGRAAFALGDTAVRPERHATQIGGAPNETWMRRTSEPCRWLSQRIFRHCSQTPPLPIWKRTWQRSQSEKKIDFLKTGMPENYRPSTTRLHGEAIRVWNGLAMLQMSTQDPQIERPAVAGDAVVRVRLRPAAMVEAHLRSVVGRLELEPDTGPVPVRIGVRHAELEGRAGFGARDDRAPVVPRPEVETVLGTNDRGA